MTRDSNWTSWLAAQESIAVPAVDFFREGSPRAALVIEGAVDLFLTEIKQTETAQALRAVYRITAGNFLVWSELPEQLAAYQVRFVALPGTRLLPLDSLMSGAPLPPGDELEVSVAEWIGGLVRAGRSGLVPSQYREPEPTEPFPFGNAEVCAVASAMRWVEIIEGQVTLMGNEELLFQAGSVVCLHADAWIAGCGEARLQVLDFRQIIIDRRLLSSLVNMQTVLMQAFIVKLGADDVADAQRLQARREEMGRQMEGGLRRLAGLLDPGLPEATWQGGIDPVLSACRIVGAALDISFPDLPSNALHLPADERLAVLADMARVQKRRVALRGCWWAEDAGPMVGFTMESGEPVALLPDRAGGYSAVSPHTGEQQKVDSVLAATLAHFAYGFFRSLPARPIAIIDLVRLGLSGRRREAGMVLSMAMLLGILGTLAPLAMGYLFDHVIPEANRNQLLQMVIALLGAAFAALLFSLFRSEVLLRLETSTESALQAAIWDRVLKLPVRFFRNYSAGDLEQRINAVNLIYQHLSGTTISGLLGGLFSFLNLALLFYLSPMLALVALGLVVVAIAGNGILAYLILRKERQNVALQGKLSSRVLDYLNGIAKLRVAAAEGRAFARWAETFAQEKSLHIDAQILRNAADVFVSTFSVIASAVIFYLVAQPLAGGNSAGAGNLLSTGTFVAFTGTFANFFLQFIGFSNTLLSLLHLLPQLERARPILEAQPEADPVRTRVHELRGNISASNLVFRYRQDGPPILDGVSFSAREGEFLAVVGPSGSGKSTLMRLLLGFERAESGSIYFDGKDLEDLDLQSLRKHMGVVLQSGQLMPGDIYTNIVGALNLTVDDAWVAARLCGLDADIEAMPMGMHTMLAEGASTFSGGQKQRIMIARAIVRHPRVLLFDEATSALDNRTQALVSHSVERLKATRIVIAHRLSTIINADRILVMDRGRIVQSGTYSELMEQPGLFRELAERQLA
ncbi:MAG: NHLP bacteriocin export ABC transporter permease/ATPase subunit [Propionivibrio sp.]|uniref:NHLP bacteriocin export ABC transporter permease/ATPase subunit n=1 Tax=Propionivibrio sp. TaxID=2212460 RepID=UPI001A3FCE6B|nr:NHLP bacteriocin export ABC transporter permease/ATPase subunit [Propionivibrio sp.]MBL8412830.1 NHLP bacteriocin export ABC transporter permease/ATPase subunit [Propionivibrio sp.]